MLYNPNWKKVAKSTDIESVESLIAWLEEQNPNEKYSYINPRGCLLAQYFTAMGMVGVSVSHFYYGGLGFHRKELPQHLHDIAFASPHTFGAALERAKEYLV